MTQPGARRVIAFGVFELDLDARQLRKAGRRLRLRPQPLQLLAFLLERSGQVVTREELRRRLWPADVFVDFDRSLNKAIGTLRDVLADSAESPRYIETLPRIGYRFIAPIRTAPLEPLPVVTGEPHPILDAKRHASGAAMRRSLGWIGVLATLAAIVIAVTSLSSDTPPRIVDSKQLSRSPHPKSNVLLTDGQRLFFTEQSRGRATAVQLSKNGGDAVELPIPLENAFLLDLSRDGSELLVGSVSSAHHEDEPTLWIVGASGSGLQRVGEVHARAAAWSPRSDRIVFALGEDVYVTERDGQHSVRLATLPGPATRVRWSPDGNVIRCDVGEPAKSAIWELSSSGKDLHPLFDDRHRSGAQSGGEWTWDGHYYIFQSERDGARTLWARRERTGLLGSAHAAVQLTFGPGDIVAATPSRDGSTVFAIEQRAQAELVQYDATSRGFVPFLSGLAAEGLAPSRDEQWITYVLFPEGTLWRSRVDGSDRLQLTQPPLRVGVPQWSPDGKSIAFSAHVPELGVKMFVVSADGGTPRQLLPGPATDHEFSPFWSSDGSRLVFGGFPGDKKDRERGVRIYELSSGKDAMLTGSQGMTAAVWSWDGRYIAAMRTSPPGLMLYDTRKESWSELFNGSVNYFDLSHDGRYVYFDTTWHESPAIYRISTANHRLEHIADLAGVNRTKGAFDYWFDLGPKDALLLLRNTSSEQVYALNWRLPR